MDINKAYFDWVYENHNDFVNELFNKWSALLDEDGCDEEEIIEDATNAFEASFSGFWAEITAGIPVESWQRIEQFMPTEDLEMWAVAEVFFNECF